MKRFLAVLLLAVFAIGVCNSFAEDVHSEPILFRGVKWGASYKEVMDALPDGVKMYALDIREYWYPIESMMYTGDSYGDHLKAEIGCYCYSRSSSLEGIKVAGYEVKQIYLYFIFVPDENGKLIRDEDHTAFICGYYTLEPKDPDAVFEDLTGKLTSLYGDVDVEKTDPSTIIAEKMKLWKGAEGTMVSILKEDYESGSHYIYIKYGFAGADELMKTAYEAAVREETEGAASNVDGL